MRIHPRWLDRQWWLDMPRMHEERMRRAREEQHRIARQHAIEARTSKKLAA